MIFLGHTSIRNRACCTQEIPKQTVSNATGEISTRGKLLSLLFLEIFWVLGFSARCFVAVVSALSPTEEKMGAACGLKFNWQYVFNPAITAFHRGPPRHNAKYSEQVSERASKQYTSKLSTIQNSGCQLRLSACLPVHEWVFDVCRFTSSDNTHTDRMSNERNCFIENNGE